MLISRRSAILCKDFFHARFSETKQADKDNSNIKQAFFLYNKMDIERVEEHFAPYNLGILKVLTEKAILEGRVADIVPMLNRRSDLRNLLKKSKFSEVIAMLNDHIATDSQPAAITRHDRFEPASLIAMRLKAKRQTLEDANSPESQFNTSYFKLSEHGFSVAKNVKFTKRYNAKLMQSFLDSIYSSEEPEFGFDTESSLMVSGNRSELMQLASQNMILVIDTSQMLGTSKLTTFLRDLFENPEICKVGNGFQGKEAMSMVQFCGGSAMRNALDVQTVYRVLFPEDSKSSLKHMTHQLYELELCKIEQLSNWRRRPLRKAQLHYAAADAFVPLLIKKTLSELSQSPLDFRKFSKDYT